VEYRVGGEKFLNTQDVYTKRGRGKVSLREVGHLSPQFPLIIPSPDESPQKHKDARFVVSFLLSMGIPPS